MLMMLMSLSRGRIFNKLINSKPLSKLRNSKIGILLKSILNLHNFIQEWRRFLKRVNKCKSNITSKNKTK